MNMDGNSLPANSARAPAQHFLEYDAFRQLCEKPYLEYAKLRTGDAARAAQSVARAFAALSARWTEALHSPCLAADAWNILSAAVGPQNRCDLSTDLRHHCDLTAAQADAVRLHHRLGLTVRDTAALLGTDPHTVTGALRSAARNGCTARPCLRIL
ncbi:hypothetical protein ACIP6P_31935 [Streptomyces sp. NPDC088729]|uniref:hypothetical protein n=1 Tax=Streptomyces sp. NPDC088729 TaxID=3365876 RepID=UPI0037F7FE03